MRSLKYFLERPYLIFIIILCGYGFGFNHWVQGNGAFPWEIQNLNVLQDFSQGDFPPKIGAIRDFADWGKVGYYSIVGKVFFTLKQDLDRFRIFHFLVMAIAMFLFLKLGFLYTYKNRLNPAWVSGALLLVTLNPYIIRNSVFVGSLGLLLVFSFLALLAFVYEKFGLAAFFAGVAALIHCYGLLLPIAFILARLTEERGRIVRPERIFYFLFPIIIGILPFIVWNGPTPEGSARQWYLSVSEETGWFHFWNLLYALALLPLYTLWYTWAWAFKARVRAVTMGAILMGLSIPLFFIFPFQNDLWEKARLGLDVPLGFIDMGARMALEEYKNLVLFVPYLAGVFLFAQVIMMEILDRSKVLRFLIFLFFAVQPFLIKVGDEEFTFIIPFLALFSLSEALVGEEGNLRV